MRRRPILLIGAAVMALTAGTGAYLLVQSTAGGQEKETLFEITNRKLAANGQPTLASEAELTWTPAPSHEPYTPTPGPSPTPVVPVCAQGTISGAAEIVAQYGGSNGTCLAAGRFLFFVISGYYDTPLVDDQGGIAVYACAEEDPCAPDKPLAAQGTWTFYPAPSKGKFKVQGFLPPDALIILGMGQICFSLTTGEYGVPCPVRTFPPAPPSPPESQPTSAGSSTPVSP
jgi:hypothetical protein